MQVRDAAGDGSQKGRMRLGTEHTGARALLHLQGVVHFQQLHAGQGATQCSSCDRLRRIRTGVEAYVADVIQKDATLLGFSLQLLDLQLIVRRGQPQRHLVGGKEGCAVCQPLSNSIEVEQRQCSGPEIVRIGEGRATIRMRL
jgi:hypothetical protein